ncbi:hypothetical protein EYC80_007238 [Monilinia laxa]|uniref:Uncharacterized protein n=1 Tax=Monilinia laxa TaxID=61186 RepID=A0A5N6K119_MONLA|nr:hypothetical protein EYC80_007238 [Monilinia laxa]
MSFWATNNTLFNAPATCTIDYFISTVLINHLELEQILILTCKLPVWPFLLPFLLCTYFPPASNFSMGSNPGFYSTYDNALAYTGVSTMGLARGGSVVCLDWLANVYAYMYSGHGEVLRHGWRLGIGDGWLNLFFFSFFEDEMESIGKNEFAAL